MTKYKVTLVRVEYLSQIVEVEAENQAAALDAAWDKSGKWTRVDAEEYADDVEVINDKQDEIATLNLWNT